MSSEDYFNKRRLEEIDKCKKKQSSLAFVDDADET